MTNSIGYNIIEVWQPRWKDRKVLIAKYKVGTLNKIVFTKAKAYEGMEFIMLGKDIAKYPIDTNGKIACYAVPLDVVLDAKLEAQPATELGLEFNNNERTY